ncbi:enoyl-CoA hydratase [Streptomyces fulvoviolaceus]|uniref:enoyl-CoA hydratase n=1 Tax=Streptomyces fulvoviolaceus TaxID=285535 RepID=UPI0021BE9259|nr:enoyl-CoA hydratase [Streptomyces fulvoviolaceus]MCT9076173.1 enoyl-CoA hydratase [Streptomyces fulvoviolaceus]
MSETVLVADVGSVRILTLNRPEARNALGGELISALYTGLVDSDSDPEVRAVVLTGVDPAFCAGVDLKQAAREGEAYFRRHREEPCVQQVARMTTPVIGAINGATFTGGLEIALGCDFLVASERAVFADTHARVGVLPGGGMTARLPGVVGQAWARRMSFTGEVIGAAEALRIGLVTEVVAHDALLDRAIELATAVTEVPHETMRTMKRIYREGGEPTIGAALAVEQAISEANRPDLGMLEDRRRAVTARNRDQL